MGKRDDIERGRFGGIDPELVAGWLGPLDVSAGTKGNYELGFREWCLFVEACGYDFDELEEEHVLEFKSHLLDDKGVSPGTASLYLSGVRSFYRHAEARGLDNIARNVRGARKAHGHKKEALSAEQARRMLASFDPDGDERELRDRAIVSLLIFTGLRDIEVVRASVRDLGEVRGHRVLHIWGKGRSEADALVKIVPALDEIIGDYLETRGSPAPSDALFASCSKRNRGGRLTTRSVSGIAKKALARIGVDDPRYTAHSLRHTSITLGLLGGATPEEVQAMARHADISTTMIYAHDLRRLEDAAEDKVAAMLAGA